jgi:hypothetical protein
MLTLFLNKSISQAETVLHHADWSNQVSYSFLLTVWEDNSSPVVDGCLPLAYAASQHGKRMKEAIENCEQKSPLNYWVMSCFLLSLRCDCISS